MNTKALRKNYRMGAKRQKGVVATLLAIIVLVATLLAAVALMRSIDTSTTIAGSLAFRQNVIQEAERAYTYIKVTNPVNFLEPTSDSNQAGGYYASLQTSSSGNKGVPDILISQASSNTLVSGVATVPTLAATANQVYYVVERLCPAAGPADPTKCSVPGATIQGGSSSNQSTDKGAPFNSGSNAAFRLTVLVKGQKNTIGYVQTVLR